ncbi:MAG: glucodextranase DOMON-like domain-containing protein, partial [Candidatus Thermoplasmatota archaeon]|nr:glucodextranase DOMON-like domain-containing protein [Candidatus Thermoplasmatota archaeon]
MVHDDWAWEVAISATGEPGAVKAVEAATGETSAKGIEVDGDAEANTITITVSKNVIGPDVGDYRYVIVLGSQDGFGTGKWRDVDESAKTWRLGGGADPSPVDGVDYDPNIIDVLLPEGDQTAMLASYDVAAQQHAVLTGFEMPDVAQQVYGASVGEVTASTAVVLWSTTVETNASVAAVLADQPPSDWSAVAVETPAATDHAFTVTGLEAGRAYWVRIMVENGDQTLFADLNFTTSNKSDTTPPEILNLAVDVVSGSSGAMQLKITWYTDEATTESVELLDAVLLGDTVALKKNHEMVFIPDPALTAGTYTTTVTAVDASGNSNTSTTSFTVEEEDVIVVPDDPDSGGETADDACENGVGEDCPTSTTGPSSDVLLGLALLVVLLVVAALVRTRRA